MLTTIFSAITNTLSREFRRMVSRPIYFIGTVLVMAFCFVFFLTFFSEGQPNKMPIAVVDKDNSALSRQFARNLNSTQQADIVMKVATHTEAREEMQKGNIYAFVEIDKGFAREVLSNRRPTLKFYVNNGYLIAGSLLLKDISYMSALTSGAVQRQVLRAKGVEESRIMGIIQPIVIDTHQVGNPWANYGIYLLNVLLPGVLQLMILLMTVFAIGVEFKERTAHQWLENAGNSVFAAVTGKLLPYTIIFTLMGIISNILLYRLMQYPMNSSIGWMFLTTFLYVLAYQAVGVLFIGLTPVLRDGVTLTAFYGLLGFTFAGFTFPIEQLPYMSRIFSDLFPIRHYFNIYVNQALHGTSIQMSIIPLISLLAFNILPLFVYHRLKNAAIHQNYPVN
jgi:ABC-2 type transport system permease protein